MVYILALNRTVHPLPHHGLRDTKRGRYNSAGLFGVHHAIEATAIDRRDLVVFAPLHGFNCWPSECERGSPTSVR